MNDSDISDKLPGTGTRGPDLASDFLPALKSNPESFPVLKAFNDILDAERERARRKLVAVSLAGIVSVLVVVMGFLAAGAVIIGRMGAKNDELQAIVMKSAVRDAVSSVPSLDGPSYEELKEIHATITKLMKDNSELSGRLDEIKKMPDDLVSSLEKALAKLEPKSGASSAAVRPGAAAKPAVVKKLAVKKPAVKPAPPPAEFSFPEPKPEQNPAVDEKEIQPAAPAAAARPKAPAEMKHVDITAERVAGADGGMQDGLVPAPVMLKTDRGILIPWRIAVPE